MPIDKELLDILACPKCKGDLVLTQPQDGLVCNSCALKYHIKDDIPIMLIDEAEKIEVEKSPPAKKTDTGKTAAKKIAAKKTTTKRATAKKTGAKKATAKKPAAKKSGTKKPGAKKKA
jgi:uncharacterized protein YbaR (Trm112 family)